LLPIIKVDAPERTFTSGHSISVVLAVASPVGAVSFLVAFDDDENRSSGELLNKLLVFVLPQAPSANVKPASARARSPVILIRC
jgi:hypothetical protein